MPADRERVVLTLPASARVMIGLAGVLLVGMLAVLIAVLVSLEGTRSEIRTTRKGVTAAEQRFQRATEQLAPLLEATKPLTEKSAQRELQSAGRSLTGAARRVPDLADDARRGVGAAYFIAQTLNAADLPSSLSAVQALADAALPAAQELARGGGRSLAECDERLRTQALTAPGQIRCLVRVVPNIRGLLQDQRNLNRGTLATQKRTLARTRTTNEQFAESLAIQREILERARSIDRKLPLPPASATSPAPWALLDAGHESAHVAGGLGVGIAQL